MVTYALASQWIRRQQAERLLALPILRVAVFAAAGAMIGWKAWCGSPSIWDLVWILALPLVWGIAPSRWTAVAVAGGYYLAASRALPGASEVFFGASYPWWFGWALWLGASSLLTLPFMLCWTKNRRGRSWLFVAAVVLALAPPIGLIGWASALSIAGVLYPGMAWMGVVLTCALFVALVAHRWPVAAFLLAIGAGANVIGITMPAAAPANWRGVDTAFSKLGSGIGFDPGQILYSLHRVDWLVQFAKDVPAKSVVVLPETVLGRFDPVAELALAGAEANLAARGATILVGAEVPRESGAYQNSVVVLGARGEARMAAQGIPVPVSMWKPWAKNGAEADVFGRRNVIKVAGRKVGVMVCYEQLLAFSLLRTMLAEPDVLVGVSNVWWAVKPEIPFMEAQTLEVFARLFGVGTVSAKNGGTFAAKGV